MKYVALLRGINVGGRNLLPMKDLVKIFEEAGCTEVRTYIQSGNVVFSAPAVVLKAIPARVTALISGRFGFETPIIARSAREVEDTIRGNPFLAAGKDVKTLHAYFLADVPKAEAVRQLDPDRSPGDAFVVVGKEVYLYLPNGMGRTKLTNAWFDARLSTISTARNWATVLKLSELAAVPE